MQFADNHVHKIYRIFVPILAAVHQLGGGAAAHLLPVNRIQMRVALPEDSYAALERLVACGISVGLPGGIVGLAVAMSVGVGGSTVALQLIVIVVVVLARGIQQHVSGLVDFLHFAGGVHTGIAVGVPMFALLQVCGLYLGGGSRISDAQYGIIVFECLRQVWKIAPKLRDKTLRMTNERGVQAGTKPQSTKNPYF